MVTDKRQYHCLDMWAISDDIFKLSDEERSLVVPSLIRSSKGPFLPNSLDQKAPMTFSEEALAMIILFVFLGGPLVWMCSSIYFLVLGNSITRVATIVASVVLAFHPMPSEGISRSFATSRYTQALYRYFTYRFVWTDDNLEASRAAAPWIGASPPHGVLPFANVLSIPVINSITNTDFVGAPASVVFRTPFLRYMTIYPCKTVDKKTIAQTIQAGTSVGLVPDGIAGIFHQSKDVEVVALKHRKGLARHALREGTTVLPAYSFGNTAVFASWWDRFGVLEWLSRKSQASIFVYWGRFGLPIPRRAQITMVFGSPIQVKKVDKGAEPTEKEIAELHDRILLEIRDCFESHKGALGWGEKELVFV